MSNAEVFPIVEVPPGEGGGTGFTVKPVTGDYPAQGGDSGKTLFFNSSSPATLTLPAYPPSTDWIIAVDNAGSGAVTIDRNGRTIDGVAANLVLNQNQGCFVQPEDLNYITVRGIGGGAVPTGTGFRHVTAGVEDGTAVAITPAYIGASPVLARTTAAIDAGTLAAGASSVGTVTMCKSGFLYKVVAVAKSWLRLYKTAAGRDADLSRVYGTAPGDVGLLVEIAWLGTASLTWEMQQNAVIENGDGSPATTIYWSVFNREAGLTHQTYTLTYMGIET